LSRIRKRKAYEEKLRSIIDLCRSVEEGSLDPFLVDVDEIIKVVRELFPLWKSPEELCMDVEAIHGIASVIKLQGDWVKERSTSLYKDPFLLEEKIRKLSKEEFVNIFLKVWRPIVELEQISSRSLAEAVKYWRNLPPLSERWGRVEVLEAEAGTITIRELAEQRIFAEKAFSEEIEALWKELRSRVGEDGKISYWDFIGAETYQETVRRAYLTSFLITYGYATLEVHRLEDEIYIKPFEKPVPKGKRTISIPISVSFKDWEKWKKSSIEGDKP